MCPANTHTLLGIEIPIGTFANYGHVHQWPQVLPPTTSGFAFTYEGSYQNIGHSTSYYGSARSHVGSTD